MQIFNSQTFFSRILIQIEQKTSLLAVTYIIQYHQAVIKEHVTR